MARRFMSNNPKWRGGKPYEEVYCDDCGRNFSQIGINRPYMTAGKKLCLDCFHVWLTKTKYLYKKKTKQIFSDIDPYGEEDWEN